MLCNHNKTSNNHEQKYKFYRTADAESVLFFIQGVNIKKMAMLHNAEDYRSLTQVLNFFMVFRYNKKETASKMKAVS
jgi:hypothetical protein